MPDREKVIKAYECCKNSYDRICEKCPYEKDCCHDGIPMFVIKKMVALLKEQDNLLGMQQTANGITFLSTGTAKQGEERGILLGKSLMHEWIYKELLHKGLLTDDIRSIFEQAKRI